MDANFTAAVTKETLIQIQTKQNREIKALCNLDYLTPTKQMHKYLKLLKAGDIGKIIHWNLYTTKETTKLQLYLKTT